MPFNIFGEEFHDNCRCTGCQRERVNSEYTDGRRHATLAAATRARETWIAREGMPPRAEYTPGTIRHTEPVSMPETVSMAVTSSGGQWAESDAGGQPFDDGAAREYTAMIHARAQGIRWRVRHTEPPPPLTPDEQLLARYPRGADPRRNYSWRPSRWTFLGDGPSFYGMEIEVKCRNVQVMHHALEVIGAHGHLKNDSSIGGGFEIVTHPMGYPWAMENFPWALLPELERLGCTIDPVNNGIHVHVNRAGFATNAHMLRWLKFIYRNKSQVIRIARRQTERFGGFSDVVQTGQLSHIKAEKARDRVRGAEERFRQDPTYENEIAYAEASRELEALLRGDPTRVTRYQAVNTRGLDTLEMRMFASTLGVLEAQAALQLAAASVEYTRGIRAKDVCHGGWQWVKFSAWLRENEKTYEALVKANRYARMPPVPAATYTLSKTARRGL